MPEVLDQAGPSVAPRAGADRLRLWRPDIRLVCALIVPLLVVCFSSKSFLYDLPGSLDSNIYLGYFLHYSEHLPLFDDYYKISRLPWVLPGFAAYRLLGPELASFVLPVGTMVLALACLYLLLRDTLEAGTALLGVVLLGGCSWFHGVGGWNYHMTAATGYYLLTVLCLGRAAAGATPKRWFFLSGVALALTVHTFVFMAAFVPGLIMHGLLMLRPERRRVGFIASGVLLLLGGLAAATVVLGTINWCSGGDWLFFWPIIKLILWLSEKNDWYKPLSVWLPTATYLTVPVAALFSCPLAWLFGKPGRDQEGRSAGWAVAGFQVQLVWAVLICCYYQLVKHQTTLDHNYFAVALLGPAVLTLCGFLHSVRQARSPWRPSLVFVIALAAIVLPFLVIGHWDWVVRWGPPIAVPCGLACAGLLCLALGRKSTAGFVAGLLLVGLANADSRHQPRGTLHRDAFHFRIEADRFASQLDPTLSDIKYWFHSPRGGTCVAGPGQPTTGVCHGFVATRGWLGNLLGSSMPPPLDRIEAKHIGNFSRIGVLAKTSEKAEWRRRMSERFEELGMPLQWEWERDFHHGDIEVSLTVYRIQKPEPPQESE